MKTFSGWEYLLIDLANNFGHDKLLFEQRIKWAYENLHQLEDLAGEAETKPLYMKAVMAIRKAQAGKPMGHLVELDACCSGLQILSAITGCVSGAAMCGLVDPNLRADAYSIVTQRVNDHLSEQDITVDIPRKKAKEATMTVFYGSKQKPIEIFGENTPELDAFYKVITEEAPGAWEALQDTLAAWQPYALVHEWQMPDGFQAKVKVMTKKDIRIEVDELII